MDETRVASTKHRARPELFGSGPAGLSERGEASTADGARRARTRGRVGMRSAARVAPSVAPWRRAAGVPARTSATRWRARPARSRRPTRAKLSAGRRRVRPRAFVERPGDAGRRVGDAPSVGAHACRHRTSRIASRARRRCGARTRSSRGGRRSRRPWTRSTRGVARSRVCPPARCVWHNKLWAHAVRRWTLPELLAALKAVDGAGFAEVVRLCGARSSSPPRSACSARGARWGGATATGARRRGDGVAHDALGQGESRRRALERGARDGARGRDRRRRRASGRKVPRRVERFAPPQPAKVGTSTRRRLSVFARARSRCSGWRSRPRRAAAAAPRARRTSGFATATGTARARGASREKRRRPAFAWLTVARARRRRQTAWRRMFVARGVSRGERRARARPRAARRDGHGARTASRRWTRSVARESAR